jgi:hypothetical protein
LNHLFATGAGEVGILAWCDTGGKRGGIAFGWASVAAVDRSRIND